MIRELAWDIALPLAAYFGLHLMGVKSGPAALAATLVAGARVIWAVVRGRTFNPYAMVMMVVFGLDLALQFLTGGARITLVKGAIIAATLGIMWLVMVALGHPPGLEAAKMWEPDRAAWRAEQFRTNPVVRHGYRTVSIIWGAAFVSEAVVLVLLIYLLPTAAMDAVSIATGIIYIAALIGWTGWYQRHLA